MILFLYARKGQEIEIDKNSPRGRQMRRHHHHYKVENTLNDEMGLDLPYNFHFDARSKSKVVN